MKTRPIAVALLLAFAPVTFGVPFGGVTFGVSEALAQDDASTKAARARFQEGVEYYDKGQYENARAAFLQAYALRKHPAVLLNLAQSSLRSGHTLEAARYFQQYLRESTSMTPQQKNDAERGLREARAKLGRIEVDAPAGADIFVDDALVGTAPLRDPVDVEPGSHAVKARGRTDDVTSVSVTAGQTVTAHLGGSSAAATPAPLPTPPPSSSTTAPPAPSTTPSEAPPSSTEPTTPAAPPATETVTAESGSHGVFATPTNTAPVYILGGVAVVSFGTAIAMAIAKQNAQNSADSVAAQIRANLLPGQQAAGICASTKPADVQRYGKACSALKDDNDKVNTDATIANVALGVGIGASVLALGYWMFASKGSSGDAAPAQAATRPVLTPIIGAGTGGLSVSGAF